MNTVSISGISGWQIHSAKEQQSLLLRQEKVGNEVQSDTEEGMGVLCIDPSQCLWVAVTRSTNPQIHNALPLQFNGVDV